VRVASVVTIAVVLVCYVKLRARWREAREVAGWLSASMPVSRRGRARASGGRWSAGRFVGVGGLGIVLGSSFFSDGMRRGALALVITGAVVECLGGGAVVLGIVRWCRARGRGAS
jgi:hypothetical protein